MSFFTADLHIGHQNVIKYCNRPFGSVEEMNETIIDNWNAVVGPDDTVMVLGDVCMGKIAETLPLCELLQGRKILVLGNHDRPWIGNKKAGDWRRRYEDVGFELVDSWDSLILVDEEHDFAQYVRVCHFPYEGDSGPEDRYLEHRIADDGGWLLHGHVHDAWKVRGRQINVGVDVWDFTPVTTTAIMAIIAAEGAHDE